MLETKERKRPNLVAHALHFCCEVRVSPAEIYCFGSSLLSLQVPHG